MTSSNKVSIGNISRYMRPKVDEMYPIVGGYVLFLAWRLSSSFFRSRPFRTLCRITRSPLKLELPNLKSLEEFGQGRPLTFALAQRLQLVTLTR